MGVFCVGVMVRVVGDWAIACRGVPRRNVEAVLFGAAGF